MEGNKMTDSPTETLSLCPHQVPIKFGCDKCTIDGLIQRISRLERYKNLQVDENRKISRRVDEIGELIDSQAETIRILCKMINKDKKHYCCPMCEGKGILWE
jgi:hypothetical protein